MLGAVELPRPGRLIDVGSGNGSPGLVFALLREDLDVVLLEPRQKRWAFLREATRAAGLGGRVEVLRCRHDGYSGPAAGTVTMRAVAIPLGELQPLVAARGEILVLGGTPQAAPPFLEARRLDGVRGGAWLFRRSDVPRGTAT